MSMHATIYGRAAFEPKERTTRNGNAMTSCRLAVDVTGKDQGDQETLWIDVLAFGQHAETLAKLGKGDMISAMGRCTRGQYTTQAGETRESWALLADAIVTARSGRPGQRKANQAEAPTQAANRASVKMQAPTDFDDDIPPF